MLRFFKLSIIGIVLSCLAVCCWGSSSVQQVNEDTAIDWTNHIYTARGEGVMPSVQEEPNRARAYLKAKGYARMAAAANLLMAIQGTAIDYEASGADYMADETIRLKVEGYIQNLETVSEKKEIVEGQTMVVVEVRAPMFGPNSLARAFLSSPRTDSAVVSQARMAEKSAAVDMKKSKDPVDVTVKSSEAAQAASAKPSEPGKPHTSLVIDTNGHELDRCMSPKIRRQDGSEVWGTVKADYDFVEESGIVAYVTSVEDARKNNRCGSNPLIIKAIGRAGGKFHSDAVVSDADAKLIIDENTKGGFLDKYQVIFVKDGKL